MSTLPHRAEVDYCAGCFVPSTIEFDGLCIDCVDLRASPFWVLEGKKHAFLYAPQTAHYTEFCRICGKGRDSALHDGSMPVEALYQTHHQTQQGDAA